MAEVGIVLTDAWQGRGLGGHLLTWLAREARRREVSTLVAETLADNQRMLRLARRTFPNLRVACASGSCTLTIDLDAWQDDARRGYERVAC
jgi:acetyltransferase